MLACDHRGSFRRNLFGDDTLTPEIVGRTADVKSIVLEGLLWALDQGADVAAAGLLMDTQTGAHVANTAKRLSVRVAIPVERGGALPVFDFEHGSEFGAHVEQHDPYYVKALAYYNPEGDQAGNALQCERLAHLSKWVRQVGRELIIEFMVPATPEQLRSVNGDEHRYDTEVRPALVVTTIKQMQLSGVYPRMWKLEGLDAEEDCRRVVAQSREGAEGDVSCIVLGRGAGIEQVHHWLATAARVPGYDGFAVGRSIWQEPLLDYTAGRADRQVTVERIGTTYLSLVDVFEKAAAPAAV
jgi:5-dehydro-2-deoxygluconokinase